MTFIQLKKAAKQSHGTPLEGKKTRIALLGDCATQHLAEALGGASYVAGVPAEVFDADYNQIDAQLLDEHSELYEFAPDCVLLFMCTQKLHESFCSLATTAEREGFAEQTISKISRYWQVLQETLGAKASILQFNFAETDEGVFGSFAAKTASSFTFQLRRLNALLGQRASENKSVFLVDLLRIQTQMGQRAFHDEKLYFAAKMPLSLEATARAAEAVVDVIKALAGRIKKCVVCDLDGTLWGGVVGDDGLEGIQIGELGLGHAFSEVQLWLKELVRRGIILAVCSKNDEDKAKEPFLHHPEMVLRLEDVSVFVANWDDKAANLKHIIETLNIGADSVVFLDDNPFERGVVRSFLPQVTVPDLPEDPAMYLPYLKSLNLFETASFSEEDEKRAAQYQAQIKREQTQKEFANYDEYLASLDMVAEARPFDEFHFPRIAQLTQRSNQFNLRTIRYTEAQIADIAAQERSGAGYITRYFTLADKFGGHGLISVLIMEKTDEHTLFISEWLMSCRVLKRGMEEFIINEAVAAAGEQGFDEIRAEYIPTAKNALVKDIYERLGFVRTGENTFCAKVEGFKANPTLIRKAED